MRKVLFKRWIPRELVKVEGKHFETTKLGTACWSEFTYGGLFHQWANASIESDQGNATYTVGLIELSDGTMEEVLPTNIKFIN